MHPIARRNRLLADRLLEKRDLKIYESFCKAVGSDVISFKDFKHSLDKILKGNCEEVPIKEILQNDKDALLACIHYFSVRNIEKKKKKKKRTRLETVLASLVSELKEQQKRKILDSVFKKYQNLCKLIGDDVITYSEFNLRYFGQLPDSDKKKKTLMNIPILVIEKIVENLEYFDRCAVRKVCRPLRDVIDTSKFTIRHLNIIFDKDYASMNFCLFQRNVQMSVDDVRVLLANSKLSIRRFEVFITPKADFEAIQTMFDSLKTQIHVECISGVHFVKSARMLLPHLKPGILKRFEMAGGLDRIRLSNVIEEIENTEYWRQAKEFYMFEYSGLIDKLHHFETIDITMEEFSMDNFLKIKQTLLTRPQFRKLSIEHDFTSDEELTLRTSFGSPISGKPNFYRYQVDDSETIFDVEIDNYFIEITRK